MAKQYSFDFDAERCVQCHACEIACKGMHDIELGVRWRRVVSIWEGRYPSVTNKGISLACMHCGNPPCEAACPTRAIKKRAEDGIVVVDPDKCMGCRACFLVCPFGVPQFGADGKMQKCNLCVDRLTAGREPACVATCPADALHFGTTETLSEQATKRSAQKMATAALPARELNSLRSSLE